MRATTTLVLEIAMTASLPTLATVLIAAALLIDHWTLATFVRTVAATTLLLVHHINHVIRNAQILNIYTTNVHLSHPPKTITLARGTNNILQVDVHPSVTGHQMSVVSLAIFQLHQHRMAFGSTEQR